MEPLGSSSGRGKEAVLLFRRCISVFLVFEFVHIYIFVCMRECLVLSDSLQPHGL